MKENNKTTVETGQPKNSIPGLSLSIPCYNEEEVLEATVVSLVEAFKKTGVAVELILVDNGSTDQTGKIIDQLIEQGQPVKKAVVKVNRGYGLGVLTGLQMCTGKWVGILCADGQVRAEDVARLFEIAERSKTDKLVKVRRRFRMDGFRRKIVSVVYNFGTAAMFGGLGSIDINGNPKIFPGKYLNRMNLRSTDWFLDAEIMIKAKRLKLEVYELNVLGQMREGGKSNVRMGTLLEFAINLLQYRMGKK